MESLQKSLDTISHGRPLVSVFFGSTSTIGQAALRVLATAAADGGKGYRTYLVGRNAKATEAILDECRKLSPEGQFMFVRIKDLALLRDVDGVCSEILKLEEATDDPRIDYLMLSQGGAIFQPRKDTEEGLDVTMSLMYYSRMKAITRLLPLLLKSNLPSTVVSVYAAGIEQKLFPDDLSLRDPKHYSYTQARSHMVYMHTLFFESLAEKHGDALRLIHIFPGIVVGPGYWSPEIPLWVRLLLRWFVLPVFGRWIATPPEVCGQRMIALMAPSASQPSVGQLENGEGATVRTDTNAGSGVYSLGQDGKNNYSPKHYKKFDRDEMRHKVWEHTVKAFEVIESGREFTD